ncbi:MAG: hypothetical protein WCT32_05825 [Patescibacteria group bacterium]
MNRLESAVANDGSRKAVVTTVAGAIRGPRYGYAQFIADKLLECGFSGDYKAKVCRVTTGSDSTRGRLRTVGREGHLIVCKAHPSEKDNGGCRFVRIFTPEGEDPARFWQELRFKFPPERCPKRGSIEVSGADGSTETQERPLLPELEASADPGVYQALGVGCTAPPVGPESGGPDELLDGTRAKKDAFLGDRERVGLFVLEFSRRVNGQTGLVPADVYDLIREHSDFVSVPDSYLGKVVVRLLVQSGVLSKPQGSVRLYGLGAAGKEILEELGKNPAEILADDVLGIGPRIDTQIEYLENVKTGIEAKITSLRELRATIPDAVKALRFKVPQL